MGRIVAVYASVGELLVLVWVESRGVCRIREIGGEEKERKRRFPSFFFLMCREC